MHFSISVLCLLFYLMNQNISPVQSRKKKTAHTIQTTPCLSTTQTVGIEEYEGKKSVLFLCRDNYIRSPILKALFIEMLEQSNQTNDWIVDSAGIGWWDVGKGMDPRAKARCDLYGLNTHHVVREISEDDYYKFEYIIASDDTDLSFLKLDAPPDSSAQILFLGSFKTPMKFPGSQDIPDPFFLKSKQFLQALDDVIHRGYWYLRGFLDSLGIHVPLTTTLEYTSIKTSTKFRSSTFNPLRVRMSEMQADFKLTHFKDRVTQKSTHRKLKR